MTAALRQLLTLADVSRARVLLAAALGTVTIVFGVGLMGTAGYLISRAAEQPPILSLTVAIVGVRFFGIARPLARYFERLSSHDVALRALGRARSRVYARIEPLSTGQLERDRRGDLLSRFVGDVDSLQDLHLRVLMPPLVAIVSGTIVVAVAALVLPAAGVVLALGLIAAAVAAPAVAAAAARRGEAEAAARGHLAAEVVELTSGSAELVAYGCREARLERLRAVDTRLRRLAGRASFAAGAGDAVRLALTGITVSGVIAVAARAHAAGRLDRVTIGMLALLALAAFEAVQPLPEAARRLRETLAAGRRVLDLTGREPEIADPAVPAALPSNPFPIRLEDVRVRYAPGERPALDGFDLRLERGRHVALVGPSGAGKTTVANALLRFVDPERGRVTFAGRDARDCRQEDVRAAVAVAGQDAHLFSASVRDNVRIGRATASDDEIEAALRDARLLEWARALPDGLDTLVGEEGRELSGGQRQRVVLARALLAEAPLLVLDEPTAHLDEPTAERLIEDVFAAAASRCVLLITHRPEGLDLVDEIVTLEPL
jgi:thiol reductant ABC exporter CydC subunit